MKNSLWSDKKITFPVNGHGTIFNCGWPLTDRYSVGDPAMIISLLRVMARAAHDPCPSKVLKKLLFQGATRFGITPRRFQSGEIDIAGHISRCGDRDVRCTLYTAANILLTRISKWSPLKAWFSQPSDQCLQRLDTTSSDCEEKRDPRQDATNYMP